MTADPLTRTPRSPVTDDLVAVGEALERVSRWIRRATPHGGPNGVALSVLGTVASAGPLRVSDLADRERISQPGMTSVVNRLVEAGLAERRADPADGRIVLVAATPTGQTYMDTLRSSRAQALVKHLRGLPVREQRALCASIDGLNALSAHPIAEEDL
jgi:DNA-binding MarR family transcriptional regulator